MKKNFAIIDLEDKKYFAENFNKRWTSKIKKARLFETLKKAERFVESIDLKKGSSGKAKFVDIVPVYQPI